MLILNRLFPSVLIRGDLYLNKKLLAVVAILVIGFGFIGFYIYLQLPSAHLIDTCGNSMGNGNIIIDGPSGPEGADFDRPFRSLTVDPTNENIIYLGTERNGILKSVNGGINWTRLRYGLRHLSGGYPEIYDIVVSANNPNILYAASTDSPGPIIGDYPSSIAGVYKSSDGGSTWIRKNCGIVNAKIASLFIDPLDDNHVIIGTDGGNATFTPLTNQFFPGGIYRTINGGDIWNQLSLSSENISIWNFQGTYNNLITFGINFKDNERNLGFLHSTDNGINWLPIANELKNKTVVHFAMSDDGNYIYALPQDEYEIWVSKNSGTTWQSFHIPSGGPIVISPENSSHIVYAANDQLYYSEDEGDTNILVPSIPSDSKFFDDIIIAPSNSSVLYAVKRGYIIYKSIDSGRTFFLLGNLRDDILNG